MAIHALRNAVGDERFFRLLRVWVREQGGGHVTIEEFIATAERVTRMQLDDLFETWLFTPSKPEGIEITASAAALRAAPGPGPACATLKR
jgi:aminopeptidase N